MRGALDSRGSGPRLRPLRERDIIPTRPKFSLQLKLDLTLALVDDPTLAGPERDERRGHAEFRGEFAARNVVSIEVIDKLLRGHDSAY